ncbi:hypothetical protein [Paenibacillus macerans]|uniref:hypothetical protein n=1 Tax=Paenibacillus macerans TaxID=44252 RepID=UPI00203B292B|nr:hypothetical protein [Paenibacillus macerans]MCM3697911.1 hypothetical protein [Paenibacillus macerans]
MEVNAGTELQPFTSRYNSEQACMSKINSNLSASPPNIFFSRACLFLCYLFKWDNRAKSPDSEY